MDHFHLIAQFWAVLHAFSGDIKMKITKQQLKDIIKEEIEKVIQEADTEMSCQMKRRHLACRSTEMHLFR
jgi:hypothetical protein